MARIAHVVLNHIESVDIDGTINWVISGKELRKVCAMVSGNKEIIIGRYGTNKAALHKLLAGKK